MSEEEKLADLGPSNRGRDFKDLVVTFKETTGVERSVLAENLEFTIIRDDELEQRVSHAFGTAKFVPMTIKVEDCDRMVLHVAPLGKF